MKANPRKLGMVFATMLGGVHLVWSVFVALGWAQALVTFSLWAHMMHFNFTVGPFDMTAAVTLIIVASLIGYCIGYVAGNVWNRVHK
jgi:hypothetical protein